MERSLPEFASPPVIETFLSVQFKPLKSFSILHFGEYWATIKKEYPRFDIREPLGAVIERFGPITPRPKNFVIQADRPGAVRCWFINLPGSRLIQIQNDRFVHNWRKVEDQDKYVHYHNIKPTFLAEWQKFLKFLEEQNIEKPEVNQCEVSYVNHIKIGQGWNSYGDLDRVLRYWSPRKVNGFLPEPESMNLSVNYVMPERRGRLHVQSGRAFRTSDHTEVIQLNLTARGAPESSNEEALVSWLDYGHTWIVSAFAEITSEEMHKKWERQR